MKIDQFEIYYALGGSTFLMCMILWGSITFCLDSTRGKMDSQTQLLRQNPAMVIYNG